MQTEKEGKWFHGKGIKPTASQRRAPIEGVPNTNIDFYNEKTGTLHRRRKIGENGKAKKDMDVGYPNSRESNDHVHDWDNNKRSPKREPTKQEKRELDRAKRKRRSKNEK
jgi:hypothetical protein